MSAPLESPPSKSEKPITNVFVLGAHLTWFILGPMALLVILYGIGQSGSGWATALDALYFAFAFGVLFARWIDQKSGQGLNAEGKPSTWADFRRYVYTFVPLAVVLWIAANVIGNHF
jgi:hypothetical protein